VPDLTAATVVDAYSRNAARIRQRVTQAVLRTWLQLPNYRDADIARFVAVATPLVSSGQLATAALTAGYLSSLEFVETGERSPVEPIPAEEVTTQALRGVPAEEVYRRPAVEVYTALSDGLTLTEAVTRGRHRLNDLVSTDLQLAKTYASKRWLDGNGRVTWYRRTLTGPTSCGLCIVASTQRYHKKELLPCHPACNCSVRPQFGRDPGQVIDPATLRAAHDSIGERFGTFSQGSRELVGVTLDSGDIAKYRDVLVVHNHGEIGPVLAVRGQKFTGPSVVT
jgi:hypothetical protein